MASSSSPAFSIASLLALLTTAVMAQIPATFTHYGIPDSANCAAPNALDASCGFYTPPGSFSAAISQNYFGAASGVGPGCKLCWLLTGVTDTNGAALTNGPNGGPPSIIVKINNLCPADSNTLCAQPPRGTNSLGGQINFDICSDSGAAAAFFPDYDDGNGPVGMAIGTAQQIDCGSGWEGVTIPGGN
ncbi:MAG: hypothetical protein M1827_005762 [Pycnora praestabilis]|nr:MAG: hypothetical protein M1827_005762 [Pycnora praestabilis]